MSLCQFYKIYVYNAWHRVGIKKKKKAIIMLELEKGNQYLSGK